VLKRALLALEKQQILEQQSSRVGLLVKRRPGGFDLNEWKQLRRRALYPLTIECTASNICFADTTY
jgi:hypothetical protein